jgi:hypothetical protein
MDATWVMAHGSEARGRLSVATIRVGGYIRSKTNQDSDPGATAGVGLSQTGTLSDYHGKVATSIPTSSFSRLIAKTHLDDNLCPTWKTIHFTE